MNVVAYSHLSSLLGYLVLTGLLLVNRRKGKVGSLLTVTCLITAAWAGLEVGASIGLAGWTVMASMGDAARLASWCSFLIALLLVRQAGSSPWRSTVLAAGTIGFFIVVCYELWSVVSTNAAQAPETDRLRFMIRLLIVICGLLLLENVYRNEGKEQRWATKFMVIGVGGILAYDFFLYASAVLFGTLDSAYKDARGFVNASAVPLIFLSAARSRDWAPRLFVSRRVVFYSGTLLASGLYLLAMAATGYYIRDLGGAWGISLQVLFLSGAVVSLAVVLSSGRLRVQIKQFVGRHFYSLKYDYREEWLRVIRKLSDTQGEVSLGDRIVQAVADIFDVTEGLLWLRDDAGFEAIAGLNVVLPYDIEPTDSFVVRRMEENRNVIEVDTLGDAQRPRWLPALSSAWLIVPLEHHSRLLGFLVLGRAIAVEKITEEDRTLLLTVGRHGAAYLGEWMVQQALLRAREFEAFNRRASFVTHDIKNLLGQLSLLLRNAERHQGNPAFVEDVMETVRNSVNRMQRLLVQLKGSERAPLRSVNSASALAAIEEALGPYRNRGKPISVEHLGEDILVAADPDRLAAVLRNLIQNAVDAIGSDGKVEVRLRRSAEEVVIEVQDNGRGMDGAFVRRELFVPFRSTKRAGYGIGAYVSREFARECGGRLEVASQPELGTTIRLVLPLAGTDLATTRL